MEIYNGRGAFDTDLLEFDSCHGKNEICLYTITAILYDHLLKAMQTSESRPRLIMLI